MLIVRFNLLYCFSKIFFRERSSPPPPNFAPPFCALCLIVCDFLPKTWNLGRKAPPQSLRDSSPKGTPLRYAASFSATAKSRPLGEGGCDQREQTEGVPRLRGRISLLFVPNSTFWGENRKRLSKVHKKAAQSLAGTALTVPGRIFSRNNRAN